MDKRYVCDSEVRGGLRTYARHARMRTHAHTRICTSTTPGGQSGGENLRRATRGRLGETRVRVEDKVQFHMRKQHPFLVVETSLLRSGRARRQVQHCPGASQCCTPPSHPTCALGLPVPSRSAQHLRYDVARAHQRLARLVSSSTRRPPPPPHAFVGGRGGRHRARHRMCVRGLRRAARARRAAQAVAARGSTSRSMRTTRASSSKCGEEHF